VKDTDPMNPTGTPATIATLGAGRMGRGIAQAFAYAGHPVWLLDLKDREPAALERLAAEALGEIDANLKTLAELGLFDDAERPAILARIRVAGRHDAPAALAGSDIVFEGVPEVMEMKQEAFAFAEPHLGPEAILASTTSTFLVNTLADMVSRPGRFLNAHWLNPAPIIPLVELSPHDGTEPAAIERLKSVLERIGKVPVLCAAAPGYIVPRLQTLIMNESARMIEEGVATAEDIDRAVRFGFGFRYAAMGVVEFIDYGGNDILYYASRYLAGALGPRYAAPAIVGQYMEEGRIGLRTGSGFYDYRGIDEASYRRDALGRILDMLRHQGLARAPGSAL
jgi:3-hydroxybutyryl-CoA dehydrogenase